MKKSEVNAVGLRALIIKSGSRALIDATRNLDKVAKLLAEGKQFSDKDNQLYQSHLETLQTILTNFVNQEGNISYQDSTDILKIRRDLAFMESDLEKASVAKVDVQPQRGRGRTVTTTAASVPSSAPFHTASKNEPPKAWLRANDNAAMERKKSPDKIGNAATTAKSDEQKMMEESAAKVTKLREQVAASEPPPVRKWAKSTAAAVEQRSTVQLGKAASPAVSKGSAPIPPMAAKMLDSRSEPSEAEQSASRISEINGLRTFERLANEKSAFVIQINNPEQNNEIYSDAKNYAQAKGFVVPTKDKGSLTAVVKGSVVKIDLDEKKGATISVKCDNTVQAQERAFKAATSMVDQISVKGNNVITASDNTIKKDVADKVSQQAGKTYKM